MINSVLILMKKLYYTILFLFDLTCSWSSGYKILRLAIMSYPALNETSWRIFSMDEDSTKHKILWPQASPYNGDKFCQFYFRLSRFPKIFPMIIFSWWNWIPWKISFGGCKDVVDQIFTMLLEVCILHYSPTFFPYVYAYIHNRSSCSCMS